jgi:nucleolar complex protein 3
MNGSVPRWLQALFEVFFRVLKHCSTATANAAATPATPAAAGAAASAGAAAAADVVVVSSSSGSSSSELRQPWPSARVHARFPLLQPTLAGLGRYAHLVSVEYFNDLMAVLQEVRGV